MFYRDCTQAQSNTTALNDSLTAAGDKGYLEAVLYQAVDAIIAINTQGAIRSFNRAAEQMFGYRASEIIGRNVKMLMAQPHHSAHDGYLHHYHATHEAKIIGLGGRELEAKRADGTIFPIELGVSEVKLPGDHFFVGQVRDISERKRSEAAVLAASRRAQLVIDSVPNGILGINQEGVIMLANAMALKCFGYERDELLGQTVEILLPNALRKGRPVLRAEFFQHQQAGRDLFAIRKDGSEFPVEVGLNPMESDGESWVLCSVLDITERKRAEQALRDNAARMAAVMNTVVDGLITIDERGTINSFNPGAERIFGYAETEAIGQNVKFLMPDPYQRAHDQHLRRYKETGVKSIIGVGREVEAKRKDGSVFPMDLAVGEMFLHDRRMYVGILRDISSRKEVENERLQLIESLKRSNQALDDFAYIASHDLKEPLRGLFNNSLFLKEDYGSLLDEQGMKRFDRIFFLCRRTERLIDDLLYFSRLGRQHLAYRKTDLNALVHDIVMQMEGAAADTIICKDLPVLVCDATRIGEVFRNLMSNALKYNDKADKRIEVGFMSEMDGKHNVFYVRDNGIGIKPEFQNDVFTLFKRLHPEDDKVRGSGVGLTFAKKIVERHGGHIWLESKENEGTTFFFTIQEGVEKYE